MNIVFTEEKIKLAREKVRSWGSSYFAYLATTKGQRYDTTRRQIEKWVSNIEDIRERNDIAARVSSFDDRTHVAACFELVLQHFLVEEKYKVYKHSLVKKTGKKPDFLVETPYQNFFCEVVTVFEDPILEKNKKITELVLSRINDINDYFPIGIVLTSWLGAEFKSSDLVKFLKNNLSFLHNNSNINFPHQFKYKQHGYEIIFQVLGRREEKRGVIAAVQYPVCSGDVGSKQVKERIKEKLKKYDGVQDDNFPLVISVCSDATSSAMLNSVDYDLFGRPTLYFNINEPGKPIWGKDNSGIYKKDRNTRLSAVIYCQRKWQNTKIYPDGSFVYKVEVYHNPWARHILNREIFKNTAQLILSNDRNGMEWVNKDENRLFVFE